jgi:shikimate kinase
LIEKATAIAHGAATIINAMATGEGAAFGVDLWTKAEVELTNEPGSITGKIKSDPAENTVLIKKAILQVLKRFKVENKFGAKAKTDSNIPVARGLKSSSVAANAVTLATVAAIGKNLDDLDVINLGVDAAFEAGVTLTGAFDDACASYLGGIIITDNLKRKIVLHTQPPEDLSILFHYPEIKAYTQDTKLSKIRAVAPLVKIAHKEACSRNFWGALSLNGLIYSSALGFDTTIALDALDAGATAAGLCGKGPTVTAIVAKDRVDDVRTALQSHEGIIISSRFNCEKARVVIRA